MDGNKRYLLVDRLGLRRRASAGIQDRDGGIRLLATKFWMDPVLKKRVARGGYQGAETFATRLMFPAITRYLPPRHRLARVIRLS